MKLFIGILFLGAGGVTASDEIVSDLPARQEAGKVMADLRLNYGQLQIDQKELLSTQRAWSAPLLAFNQQEALREKIQKEQINIQDDTKAVVGDLRFLLSNWSYLTQADKDFVSQAEEAI
jgi:hypothetical protein